MVEIRNLTVEVEGARVLEDVSLEIPAGEVHLLLGPNGSGKTSLMMTVMGYPQYHILDGKIIIDGEDLTDAGLSERAAMGVGLSEQRPPAVSGVKMQMLMDYILKGDEERRERVMKIVEETGMTPFLSRNINYGLSGGEIKRSELLFLLCSEPKFSMLDEPDSGVDLDSLETVISMMNKLFSPDGDRMAVRKTGMVITHSNYILDRFKVDKAHVLMKGRLACSGNPGIIMDKVMASGFEACERCCTDEK